MHPMDETLIQLSPSSASNFKSCPLLFKYRNIDRLVEPLSTRQAGGSLVHAVLEKLFTQEAPARTTERANELLDALWTELRQEPEWRPTELDTEDEMGWIEGNRKLLSNYFLLEDPSTLDAARLEWWVEYELGDVQLRGVIDRVEERADGSWILTDYKTGQVPGAAREQSASLGLRFYALVCWRAYGIIPGELRLVYLADPAVLTWRPTERTLLAFERQMQALAKAVRRAADTGDWRPRPSPFCMSCTFQHRCPAWNESVRGSQAV